MYPFSGMTRVLRSSYLLAVCICVVLPATHSTLLYSEQTQRPARWNVNPGAGGLIAASTNIGNLGVVTTTNDHWPASAI